MPNTKAYRDQYRLDNRERIKERMRNYNESLSPVTRADRDWRMAQRRKSPIGRWRAARYYVKCTYGLTYEQYDQLLIDSGGRCNCCGAQFLDTKQEPSIDHEHVEGFECLPDEEKVRYVRGLLCNACNGALGVAHDNEARIAALAIYLQSCKRKLKLVL